MTAGHFFEIFIGLIPLPSSFNWFIDEHEAGLLSGVLAEFLCEKKSWRQCRELVMEAYPVQKIERRERFAEVMAGLRDYSAEELDGELLDLFITHQTISSQNIQSVDSFLAILRSSIAS